MRAGYKGLVSMGCAVALASPLAAQTVRITTQTRTDTVVSAAGRLGYPAIGF